MSSGMQHRPGAGHQSEASSSMRLVTAVVDVRNPTQARASCRGAGTDADESCMSLSFFELYNQADRCGFPD
jgi:hypothetical protein